VIISPDPQAIAQVEGDPQARFVEAVKATIDEWEEWRQTHDDRPQAGPIRVQLCRAPPRAELWRADARPPDPGRRHREPVSGATTPLYNNHQHMDAFKEIACRQLDRAFGLDREPQRPDGRRQR